jgi:hypothetical protein
MLNLIDTGALAPHPQTASPPATASPRSASGSPTPGIRPARPSAARRGVRRTPPAIAILSDGTVRVVARVSPGGRNPEWTLDAMETVVLAALLRGLKQRALRSERSDKSFTAGLTIHGAAHVLPGCRELRLHAGEVLARFDTGDRHLADPGGAIQAWLLESARHRLAPGAHRALGAALQPAAGARERR